MGYSTLVAENIYTWLFFASFFFGCAVGIFPAALLRRFSGRKNGHISITLSLFLLILAAVSLLGAIFFVSLPQVLWDKSLLFFCLAVFALGMLVRLGWQVLLPLLLALLLIFSLQLYHDLDGWFPLADGKVLGEFRLIRLTEQTVDVDLLSGGFLRSSLFRLDDGRIYIPYRRLRSDPRLFFLPSTGFVTSQDVDAPVPFSSPAARMMTRLRLWSLSSELSESAEARTLEQYGVYVFKKADRFVVDIRSLPADR
jgi:hypothetical protein